MGAGKYPDRLQLFWRVGEPDDIGEDVIFYEAAEDENGDLIFVWARVEEDSATQTDEVGDMSQTGTGGSIYVRQPPPQMEPLGLFMDIDDRRLHIDGIKAGDGDELVCDYHRYDTFHKYRLVGEE